MPGAEWRAGRRGGRHGEDEPTGAISEREESQGELYIQESTLWNSAQGAVEGHSH